MIKTSYEASIPDIVSSISTKFESEKQLVIESPIFKRKRFLVKRKEVEDVQPLRPKNLYNELSKKAIPLRKGHKNKRDERPAIPTKGLSESDRQMMKKIPERILVLATPLKKRRMCDSVIFKSPNK